MPFIFTMRRTLTGLSILVALLASPAICQEESKESEETKVASVPKQSLANTEDDEYYELLELFADTLDQVERNYVEPITKRELIEAAIQGVIQKLDPYSTYIAPDDIDQFRTEVENEFGGIGIRVGIIDDQITVITRCLEHLP